MQDQLLRAARCEEGSGPAVRSREMQAEGLDLRLVPDSLAAAQHAHTLGLIAAQTLPVVAAGLAVDQAARAKH